MQGETVSLAHYKSNKRMTRGGPEAKRGLQRSLYIAVGVLV